MKGTVKFFNKKKGYGFIYGYGSREVDEKEKLIPEYFFHVSDVKSGKIKIGDMVKFDPQTSEKGLSAVNVHKTRYKTEDDPRGYVAVRIWDEFDLKIPCLSWIYWSDEDIQEVYNFLKADEEHDEAELKRISEEYDLDKLPKDEKLSAIAYGGYDLYIYEKKQAEEYGY